MQVSVKLFGEFREAAGSERVELEMGQGATVGDVLAELSRRWPEVGKRLFDAEGKVQAYLHVFLNGENVDAKDGLATPVGEGGAVTFFPPVGGG